MYFSASCIDFSLQVPEFRDNRVKLQRNVRLIIDYNAPLSIRASTRVGTIGNPLKKGFFLVVRPLRGGGGGGGPTPKEKRTF